MVEVVDDRSRVELVERVTTHDHNDGRNPARYRRYETVAREFEALGKDEFIRRYMTTTKVLSISWRLRANGWRSRQMGSPPFQPRRRWRSAWSLDEDGDPVLMRKIDSTMYKSCAVAPLKTSRAIAAVPRPLRQWQRGNLWRKIIPTALLTGTMIRTTYLSQTEQRCTPTMLQAKPPLTCLSVLCLQCIAAKWQR